MSRRVNLVAFGLALLMILSACSGSKANNPPATTPPGGTTTGTDAKATVPKAVRKLKYASAVTPPNMIHIAPYVAQEMGFFKEEALDVEIISLEGGVGTARALLSGAVDISGTSADPIIAGVAAAPDSDEGMIAFYTYAPRVTNAMVGGPNVKTPADLKGKKLGIQDPNAFAHVLSRLVLAKAGIKESEVQFVSGSTAGRLPNLLQGRTDTAILHIEQMYKALEENPQLNFTAKIWETEPNWWYSAFAANKGKLKTDPDLYERFLRTMVKTNRWMYKPENKAKVIEIYMKYNTGFSKAIAERTYDTLVQGNSWPRNEGVSREIVEYTIATQLKFGLLKTDKQLTFEQVFDATLITKVLKELGRDGNQL
ncbi:MAG: hypothetical protein JWN15_589 [Firmicutes bacterium]|nr:hypothetical protein [Bacillota bacterium]